MQSPNSKLAKDPINFRRCHEDEFGIAGLLCVSTTARRLSAPMRTAGGSSSAGIETLESLTAAPQ